MRIYINSLVILNVFIMTKYVDDLIYKYAHILVSCIIHSCIIIRHHAFPHQNLIIQYLPYIYFPRLLKTYTLYIYIYIFIYIYV